MEDSKYSSGDKAQQQYQRLRNMMPFPTSSFYGFSFSVLVLYHSCLSQIFLSSPFLGVWVMQTADLLAVQQAEKQAVVF